MIDTDAIAAPVAYRCRYCDAVTISPVGLAEVPCIQCGARDGLTSTTVTYPDAGTSGLPRWRVGDPDLGECPRDVYEARAGRWEWVGQFASERHALWATEARADAVPAGLDTAYRLASAAANRFRDRLCEALGLDCSPGDLELIDAARRCIRFTRNAGARVPADPDPLDHTNELPDLLDHHGKETADERH